MLNGAHPQLVTKAFENFLRQSFGKDISKFIIKRNKREKKNLSKKNFSDNMVLNVDMFSAAMKLEILDESQSTLVICEEGSRIGRSFAKTNK